MAIRPTPVVQSDLPDVHFGAVDQRPVDWRKHADVTSTFDDDTELLITPPDVIHLLGFDPKELDD